MSSPSEWTEWTWQSPRYQAAPRPTARAGGKLKLDKALSPKVLSRQRAITAEVVEGSGDGLELRLIEVSPEGAMGGW